MKILETYIENIKHKTELCFYDDIDDIIYVNKSFLYDNYVGEGIDEIEIEDNTIKCYFIENAWGGISFDEWEYLYNNYNNAIKNDVVVEFSSNVSKNIFFIEFNNDVEFIDNYIKKKQENKTKKFNL
jgi:hypothetical protein